MCVLAASAGPHDELIARHAAANAVPEALVRRIIQIESRGNARLMHKGNYGLMQIRLGTARGMGYSGDATGLLDADTNLTYAVKYLAGAYRAAGCNPERAVSYYQRGYYGAARSQCAASMPAPVVAAKADVLKPRVVRIETIGAAPSRPVAPFEPARGAMPGSLQLAAIPLPLARPEFDAAPKTKNGARSLHRAHSHRAKAETRTAAKKKSDSGDPTGVVSLLKKIVATDNPSHKKAQPDIQPSPPPPL
jgi:hypothetical protein